MTSSPDTIAVLTSGGINSIAMLEDLAKKYKTVVPVYVVCGFIWEPAERFWLRRFHRQMKKRTAGEGLKQYGRTCCGCAWEHLNKNFGWLGTRAKSMFPSCLGWGRPLASIPGRDDGLPDGYGEWAWNGLTAQ